MTDSEHLIEEMNEYYNLRAPWHDYYMEYTSIEKMERRLQPIIKYIEEYIYDKNILEIGCGTGNWTQILAKNAHLVLATDSSPAVLEIARNKLAGFKNISFRLADAYTLNGVEGKFDCLFASDWWSHIPKSKINSFLDTITGKLIPESYILCLDMSYNEFFRNEPSHIDNDGNRISMRKLPDGAEYQVIKNFPTEDELRNSVIDYGIEVIYKEFESLKRWLIMFKSKVSVS